MAYRYADRKQKTLFPASIDEYIPADAPVRAYDVFVDSLDFDRLGIDIEPDKVGSPQYDPKVMLKLLIYGYSYGIRSSRKLERETHYNLSFIWLTGGLKPDHKTIAEFRRNNKSALTNVLKQCARLCIDLGLIEGNTLFIDGSKFRANASIDNHWDKQRCIKRLEKIDSRINEILSECDQIDRKESNDASLVKMKEELSDNETLRKKVSDILCRLNNTQGKESINATDNDCVKIHSRQGSHAGYNAQTVVDEKHGLIVSSDVVSDNHDYNQFAAQIEKAHETLEKNCQTACADAGYASIDELEKIDRQQIKVVVPSRRQAEKVKKEQPFDKMCFKYDSDKDCYICPEGKILKYSHTDIIRNRRIYRATVAVCGKCKFLRQCTKNCKGRTITRVSKEDVIERLEKIYDQPESQKIYNLRKQKAELPFGHIKRNLNAGHFLLRGLKGVKAEMSLLSSCFNIARMISIIGVAGLIARFEG